mmetsp:Transcript_15718/g.31666  ORF Transcript_15718/g.31666 Transcript_15718/m.31666 type:complete len:111 (+) Transcript_15718:476-808(+)
MVEDVDLPENSLLRKFLESLGGDRKISRRVEKSFESVAEFGSKILRRLMSSLSSMGTFFVPDLCLLVQALKILRVEVPTCLGQDCFLHDIFRKNPRMKRVEPLFGKLSLK